MLGAIGLFYSALMKRTQAATVLTYITMLTLTLGTTLLFVFLWSILANADEPNFGRPRLPPEQILYTNPLHPESWLAAGFEIQKRGQNFMLLVPPPRLRLASA